MQWLMKVVHNKPWLQWIVWPLWVVACYFVAGYVGGALLANGAKWLGFGGAFTTTLGGLVFQALIYAMLIALIFLAPKVRKTVTSKLLGAQRAISWSDIGLGVAGYIVYFIVLIAVMMLAKYLFPQLDTAQSQDLGFTSLFGFERFVGFIVFVVIAPLSEEFIMRGFLYGKLRQAKMPLWPAAVVVSVLFGLAHGQWNVGIDTFILSMVACYLREATDTIWPGVIIHIVKNMVAYIVLFVAMPL